MPRFSANLSMLFPEIPFLDRFAAAANAGFTGVEYVGAYDQTAAVVERLEAFGLTQALFNMPPGDWEAGERGIAALLDRTDEFHASIETALNFAVATGCTQVNCLAGLAPDGIDRRLLEETFVANLKFAAPRFAKAGVRLLIEMINPFDMPGFFLNTSRHALEILERVGSGNLYLQYDIYHMQIVEGDLARTIERLLPRIAHIQIADNPGRHEPGTGEINYPYLFRHLDALGYAGWVGAEYRPQGDTVAGLGWLEAARKS